MRKHVKIGLQLLGLAAWTTAWIGGGLLLLHKAIKAEEERDYGRPKKEEE